VTTIFVPLVQATLEGSLSSVPTRTWIACSLALAGIGAMGLDLDAVTKAGAATAGAFPLLPVDLAGLTRGDAAIIGAALLYTMHVVRLGYWANRASPLNLASAKSIVQAVLSVGLVCILLGVGGEGAPSFSATGILSSAREAGREMHHFFDDFSAAWSSKSISALSLSKLVGATVWSGLIGTAYVLYAQSLGQQSVRPTDANLVYSLQPIFTALFAYILLGETMNKAGYVGGGLILSAVYLVASRGVSAEDELHSEG